MARGGGLSATKGGMFLWQLGHPTLNSVNFCLVKQAFLQNRSFASKDGWDRVLKPLVDVLGPLRRGQGEWVHSSGGHLGPLRRGQGEWVHAAARHCLDDGGFGGTLAGGLTRPGPMARRIIIIIIIIIINLLLLLLSLYNDNDNNKIIIIVVIKGGISSHSFL